MEMVFFFGTILSKKKKKKLKWAFLKSFLGNMAKCP